MGNTTTNRRVRRTLLWAVPLVLIGITAVVLVGSARVGAPPTASRPSSGTAARPKPAPAAVQPTVPPVPFNKAQYSTSDPSSLWVVVNKQHPLAPIDYAPADLVSAYGHQVSSRMAGDLSALVNAAAAQGAYLTLASSYRSYPYQQNLYNSYVAADGQAKADTYSARPGYSEHQTGLAIDFGDRTNTCVVQDCFSTTTEGKWLLANAWQYGFLLRYTTADQAVTGYENEPWHYRYVGRPLSREMHAENVATLEEFFGVTGGPNY